DAAADEMERGLRHYRRAALSAGPERAPRAFREVLLAEQMQRMLRSAHAILEFEDLRFRIGTGEGPQQILLDRMQTILGEEIERTKASLDAALRDSRLGFQWEQDYVYSPHVLREKLRHLRRVQTIELPRLRRLVAAPMRAPAVRGPRQPVTSVAASLFVF